MSVIKAFVTPDSKRVVLMCGSNKRRDVAVLRVVAKDMSTTIVNKLQSNNVLFAMRLST